MIFDKIANKWNSFSPFIPHVLLLYLYVNVVYKKASTLWKCQRNRELRKAAQGM